MLTTQGPADHIGQGGAASLAPRFSDSTNASCAWEVQWNVGFIGQSIAAVERLEIWKAGDLRNA